MGIPRNAYNFFNFKLLDYTVQIFQLLISLEIWKIVFAQTK